MFPAPKFTATFTHIPILEAVQVALSKSTIKERVKVESAVSLGRVVPKYVLMSHRPNLIISYPTSS
jgi:hypothetical protein